MAKGKGRKWLILLIVGLAIVVAGVFGDDFVAKEHRHWFQWIRALGAVICGCAMFIRFPAGGQPRDR